MAFEKIKETGMQESLLRSYLAFLFEHEDEDEVLGEFEESGGGGYKEDGPMDDLDDKDTPATSEVSAIGGGAIVGFTGPLGMKGGNPWEKKKKGKKKSYEPSMRAFGGGSEVE